MCLGLGEELYSTSAITHIFTKRKCMVLVENSNEWPQQIAVGLQMQPKIRNKPHKLNTKYW